MLASPVVTATSAWQLLRAAKLGLMWFAGGLNSPLSWCCLTANQGHCHLWKSVECRFACFKDTVIFEIASSAALLVSRTLLLKKRWGPLCLFQGHCPLWKSAEHHSACFKDTVFLKKVSSTTALVLRTPSSWKKCLLLSATELVSRTRSSWKKVSRAAALVSRTPSFWKKFQVPLRLFQGYRHLWTGIFVHLRHIYGPICMKISPIVQNVMLDIMHYMVQPFKMQGRPKIAKNSIFTRFITRMRVLRTHNLKMGNAGALALPILPFTPNFVQIR